ncbi:MAG TPA: 2,3-bisphosphoglycerate-independent phosphoglycerate mutase [Syntrophomonadaceae bacterium]|nr:2,3-bisphosphoglycerate-independent phosphoglycerate mutase [Syntrophomonadaceae bacterium]
MSKKPLLLMILDGWGVRPEAADNAISQAHPGYFLALQEEYPHTQLKCSGLNVGLPAGLMGNSEVGHLNIGSGRIVYQEITRISQAIEDGSFYSNPPFLAALKDARDHKGAVHLMGLLSDGGVHSTMEHIYALLELCRRQDVPEVFVHAFLDGRDVGPKSAMEYVQALESRMRDLGLGRIATVQGRFYAMDRDNRWDRIELAYQAMVLGEGKKAPNALAAIENSYEMRVTDEFMEPAVIIDGSGQPLGRIQDGDSVIFYNFRSDRARQISRVFVDKKMDHFPRPIWPKVHYVCMTQYDHTIQAPVAFPPQNLQNTLGEVLAEQGLKQLRIAETEKYAHVTFFFNGGVEEPNPGEDRILIPSPKVATYNLKPEMSVYDVTNRVLEEIERDIYDVIILNFANADMVGHTGILEAAVQAVKAVDECLHQVVDAILQKDGDVIITADHGNCETMLDPVHECPFTAHTTDDVPFILVAREYKGRQLRDNAALCDIAPTMLKILNIPAPPEMTGKNIII